MSLSERYRIIDIETEHDFRGVLSHPELPFPVKSVFWLHNVSAGQSRGCHAHRQLKQFLIALKGSVEITLKVPGHEKTIILDNSEKGLFVNNLTWIELSHFKDDAIVLVLASAEFDPDDYINDFSTFCTLY